MAKKSKVTSTKYIAPKTKKKNASRSTGAANTQQSRQQQQPQVTFTNFAQLEHFVTEKRDMFEFDLCIRVLNQFLNRPNINKSDQVKAYDMLGEVYLDNGNGVGALAVCVSCVGE